MKTLTTHAVLAAAARLANTPPVVRERMRTTQPPPPSRADERDERGEPVQLERRAAPRPRRDLMLERLSGDEALLDELIATFLEDAPEQLGAIREAILLEDGGGLARASRELQTALAPLDAARAFVCAEDLEALGQTRRFRAARAVFDRLALALGELFIALPRYRKASGAA